MYADVMENGNPVAKCPCGTPGRRWDDNINVRPR